VVLESSVSSVDIMIVHGVLGTMGDNRWTTGRGVFVSDFLQSEMGSSLVKCCIEAPWY
jgi:hypothetical protein